MDAAGDSRQFVNALLEKVDVHGIRACGACGAIARRWNISEIPLAVILVEADDGLNYVATEEATAVVVDVKPEIDSRSKRVSSVNPCDVVHELRRSDRALRVGREAVRPVHVQ